MTPIKCLARKINKIKITQVTRPLSHKKKIAILNFWQYDMQVKKTQ